MISERLGEVGFNKLNERMSIVSYNKATDIIVQFDNGNKVHTQYSNFKVGSVANKIFVSRIGEIGSNFYNSKMTIIEYSNSKNIKVKFENEYVTEATYQSFKNGQINNPYDKSVWNLGFCGEGKYLVQINKTTKSKQYTDWYSMMLRCYDEKYHLKYPTYIGCTVCDEWHNFQNFAKWHDENYYNLEEKMCLDKDILNKGNKIYSPQTCVFVPNNINVLFIKSDAVRGIYPIGVTLCKNGQYMARCGTNEGQRKYLGRHSTPTKAFNSYKIYKEEVIQNIANKYKGKIPKNLYSAMMAYKVQITD